MLREDEQLRPVAARRRLEVIDSRTTAGRTARRRPDVRRAESHPHDRRTVIITGRPTPAGRRSPAARGIVARPDRVALWAFLLGLLLVLVAAATANAAPL